MDFFFMYIHFPHDFIFFISDRIHYPHFMKEVFIFWLQSFGRWTASSDINIFSPGCILMGSALSSTCRYMNRPMTNNIHVALLSGFISKHSFLLLYIIPLDLEGQYQCHLPLHCPINCITYNNVHNDTTHCTLIENAPYIAS